MRITDSVDQSIWQRFLDGDGDSLKQIVEFHFKDLLSYGSRFCADRELVKDCLQDLFIKLWESRVNLNRNVVVKAYLFASLRRMLNRRIQGQNKYLSFSADDDNLVFDFEVSVEEKLISNEYLLELTHRIAGNLATLPKRQKEVMYLKFFQDMSRDEIAVTMNISSQTVSNQMQLALKKLRANMASTADTWALIASLLLFLIIQ